MTRSLQPRLRWQSLLVLTVMAAATGPGVLMECVALFGIHPASLLVAALIGGALTAIAWRLHAATPGGAVLGGVFAMALYLAMPGWSSFLWPLLALLLLTFAATRFGSRQKTSLGLAESAHGRGAAQVAANLGMAAVASLVLGLSHAYAPARSLPDGAMLLAVMAALAEATADTLSSELGEILGGEPVLITTGKRVARGTDGAISVAGTLAGCAGALVIVALTAIIFSVRASAWVIALAAAVAGLMIDSLLGATLEKKGYLNNDAVNFLSTAAAAILAATGASLLR
jgi:uncharacterized protein (TIGR00297 family)